MQPFTLLDAYHLMWQAGINVGNRDAWLDLYRHRDYEIWPIAKDGKYVGLFLMHQVETGQILAHIAVLPEWHGKWASKSMFKAYKLWKPTCPIYAPIACANKEAQELATRLGWKAWRGADGYTIYVKEPHNES